MTALPPTIGHLALVQFANLLGSDGVVVILSTQPEEPFATERVSAMRATVANHNLQNVTVVQSHKTIPQDPASKGFWEMWKGMLEEFGVTSDDYIVASERYGQKLAEITGAQFFPYDTDRSISQVKATPIREHPVKYFNHILPEFQPYLRTTVTVFGAESTGKTTLAKALAKTLGCPWIFEYARPCLENTVNEISIRSMAAIWKGQAALQRHIQNMAESPYVIYDTDLYSTVGYWQFPHWRKQLNDCPPGLVLDAEMLKSDLYIITKSNIPFEQDPLRYGGDQREASDQYWIDICQKYQLPYIVLESQDLESRVKEAKAAIDKIANQKFNLIAYDRHGF